MTISTTTWMSFAVAGCAFAAAVMGLFINQWLVGWMAVGGMTGVGLFYLAIGLINLGVPDERGPEEVQLTHTSTHRLSSAANLSHVAVNRHRDDLTTSQLENQVEARP